MKILHSLSHAAAKVGSFEHPVEDYKRHFLDKQTLHKLTASSSKGILELLQGSASTSASSSTSQPFPVLPS
eukprot:1628748-Karenia_brevis.AAC.1